MHYFGSMVTPWVRKGAAESTFFWWLSAEILRLNYVEFYN